MKPITKQSNKKPAFTIVELLTVMSIIVILIGLLVPALNKVKRFARDVKQKAQLHAIDAAIELFNSEHDGYPPSGAKDEAPPPDNWTARADYCGAMKLAEAMVGQDLMGFHPDSAFRSDGTPDGTSASLYPTNPTTLNLNARRGPYLPLENANAYRLRDLYWEKGMSAKPPYDDKLFVLCDVYNRVTNRSTGKKIGMPILYYRANTANNAHDLADPDNPNNIYNYLDNYELVALGFPGQLPAAQGGPKHDLIDPDPKRFYINTKNDQITDISRPYRADSYILISAGWDGEYGTADDICNFDWKFK